VRRSWPNDDTCGLPRHDDHHYSGSLFPPWPSSGWPPSGGLLRFSDWGHRGEVGIHPVSAMKSPSSPSWYCTRFRRVQASAASPSMPRGRDCPGCSSDVPVRPRPGWSRASGRGSGRPSATAGPRSARWSTAGPRIRLTSGSRRPLPDPYIHHHEVMAFTGPRISLTIRHGPADATVEGGSAVARGCAELRFGPVAMLHARQSLLRQTH
jgi:hypothetical protein